MANDAPQHAPLPPVNPHQNLAERVKSRVAEVSLTLERRNGSGAPGAKRPRAARSSAPAGGQLSRPDAEREAQSLLRVYREMRKTYQQYRKKTGRPAVPALREAVHAFKRGPSLSSLVGVAVFLEDRGLLGW